MDFIKLALLILLTIFIVSSLPLYDKSLTILITLCASTVVLINIINYVTPIIRQIKSVFSDSYFEDISIVFKAMGISLLTGFVNDIATDSGNKALANQIVFAGKIAIVALALPVFIQVMELIKQMIK